MKSKIIVIGMRRKAIVGIRIWTGDDRVKTQAEIVKKLGSEYEVFEGVSLSRDDLSGIFFGVTLFSDDTRKILIKDVAENKEVWAELARNASEFAGTDAEVIIWESKLDKRLAATKNLVKAGIEIQEFKMAELFDARAVFNIYDIALVDGAKAICELEKIEDKQDPYMFFGLIVSQALKKLEWRPSGAKEKRILKNLANLDIQMKSTTLEPWMLIKSFLLRVATL